MQDCFAVRVMGDRVHDVDQLGDLDLQSGFLARLALDSVPQAFAPLDMSAGNAPLPEPRRLAAANEDDLASVIPDDRADPEDRDRQGYDGLFHGAIVHAIASEIILASRRHSRYEGPDEEQEIIMGFKFAIAVACVCVGALTLAGCNRDQANNQQPAAPGAVAAGGQQTGTAMPPAGDLSPESNQKFLADNSKMTGVTVRPSGLQYRVIKAGAGKSPTPNDQVTVTYKGSLITRQVFDQNGAGQTATFPAGQLIPGWVEAPQLMQE